MSREPTCGEDFCESCGDCLACYGADDCWGHGADEPGEHVWPRGYGLDHRTETG